MTTPGFGIPGANMMGAPAPMQPQVGFVLDIPADPTWEPFDTTDVLDQDGYYQCKIAKESGRNDANKSQGIFLTMEVQDADARGKILSRFLPDPRTAKGNVWFVWRGLLRSITGSIDGARQGLRYQPGMFTGQLVYVKTERSHRDDRTSTDIDTWVTMTEWQAAVTANRHRWAPKPVQQGGNMGALPAGTGGFPGLPGTSGPAMAGLPVGQGLPGMPSAAAPIAPATPQPGGAPFAGPPPAAAAPPAQTYAPPPQQQFAPPRSSRRRASRNGCASAGCGSRAGSRPGRPARAWHAVLVRAVPWDGRSAACRGAERGSAPCRDGSEHRQLVPAAAAVVL